MPYKKIIFSFIKIDKISNWYHKNKIQDQRQVLITSIYFIFIEYLMI